MNKPRTKTTVRTAVLATALAGGMVALTCGVASTANAGTLPDCAPGQLRVTAGNEQAGMSHQQVTYQMTNLSDTACLVQGAPSAVSQTDGAPTTTTVGDTYFSPNPAVTPIRLDPGSSAAGDIAWTSSQTEAAATTYSLNVTLPGVGELHTGATVSGGAQNGAYTVTNLRSVG